MKILLQPEQSVKSAYIVLAPKPIAHKLWAMFDLDKYLVKQARLVNLALGKMLPSANRKPVALHTAMRYSVFPGGKRIRPILCLAAAEAVGARAARAMYPAMAVELLHTYTLIHDDLPCMDNDDFRRGKPSVHRAFGEANAVLAGDALQALAFEMVAKTRTSLQFSRGELVIELARAAGSIGVVGGQVEDMAALNRRQTPAMIRFIHLHKTADLFRAALRLGAMAGGATRRQLNLLTTYGVNLGQAFQIVDDIIDKTGPGAGNELTCLAVMTKKQAMAKAERLTSKAIAAVRALGPPAYPLSCTAQFVLNRTR